MGTENHRPGNCTSVTLPLESLQALHGHPSHRRPPPTFRRAIASRIPARSNIDIHRSITPLERPHQPHRHPPSRRNRNAPLRRVFLPSPPSLPSGCPGLRVHPNSGGCPVQVPLGRGRRRVDCELGTNHQPLTTDHCTPHVLDIGSGAGFPALPLKLWAPHIHLTLIESNHKKAAFLREVARALTLTNINVLTDRAETLATRPGFPRAEVVTLRAVEHFETILPQAVTFLAQNPTLALLISTAQIPHPTAPNALRWHPPIPVPESHTRVLSIGIHT